MHALLEPRAVTQTRYRDAVDVHGAARVPRADSRLHGVSQRRRERVHALVRRARHPDDGAVSAPFQRLGRPYQIYLVHHGQIGRGSPTRERRRADADADADGGVDDADDEIRVARAPLRPPDPLPLHVILHVVPHPRGVRDDDLVPPQVKRHLDRVARRPGSPRDDRDVSPGERVEQAALPNVGSAHERDPEPSPHELVRAPRRAQVLLERRGERANVRRDRAKDVVRDGRVLAKVEHGFDVRGCGDESRAPAVVRSAHLAAAELQRLASLRRRLRVEEVREAFRLREIELAVAERAAGELAGLRVTHRAAIDDAFAFAFFFRALVRRVSSSVVVVAAAAAAAARAQPRQRVQQRSRDRERAVDVQLRDVLARERGRAVEPQEDPAVERLARARARERRRRRAPMRQRRRRRRAAGDEPRDVARARTGDAHDGDARAPGSGRQRVYRVRGGDGSRRRRRRGGGGGRRRRRRRGDAARDATRGRRVERDVRREDGRSEPARVARCRRRGGDGPPPHPRRPRVARRRAH
eukprot:31180-Pelagococcus_subviridis.AAC.9